MASRPFLWRTRADGTREVSWRLWVLIWVLPGLMTGAGTAMLVIEAYRHLATLPTQAEVVQVHAWEGETIFDKDVTNYGPVFAYEWTDGTITRASSGMSSPDFDFAIGSLHEIRYFKGHKGNVVLPGWHNWLPGLIVGALGLVLTLPATWITLLVRRWRGQMTIAGAPRT